jgi:hypothetical protein
MENEKDTNGQEKENQPEAAKEDAGEKTEKKDENESNQKVIEDAYYQGMLDYQAGLAQQELDDIAAMAYSQGWNDCENAIATEQSSEAYWLKLVEDAYYQGVSDTLATETDESKYDREIAAYYQGMEDYENMLSNQLAADERAQVSEQAIQRPIERVVQRPTERIFQRPVERVIQRPTERVIQRPIERVIQRPTERVIQRPTERVVQRPVERVIQRPTERVVQRPTERVIQRPTERVIQRPTERVVQRPIE